MDSPSVPVSADSIKELSSPSPTTAVSRPSKTTRKPRAASVSASRKPKSSKMQWDSMDDPGVASFIASLRAGLVSPILLPESGSEQPTSGGSGATSPASSTKPALPYSSERTSADSFGTPAALLEKTPTGEIWTTGRTNLWGVSEPFSGIWPAWGLCLRGAVYELPKWAPVMGALESLSLPSSQDGKESSWRAHRGNADTLTSATALWQTPATDSFRSRGGDRKDEMGLDQQARFWPMPTAKDEASSGSAAYSTESGRHPGTTLTDATRRWPESAWQTPNARDGKSEEGSEGNNYDKTPNLSRQVYRLGPDFWKTPHGLQFRPEDGDPGGGGEFAKQACSWSKPSSDSLLPDLQTRYGLTFWQRVRILRLLCRQLRQHLPSPYRKAGSIFKRKLNPTFTDWLMGWPISPRGGWSDADHVFSAEEMAWFRSRQRFAMSLLLGDSPGFSGSAGEAVLPRALPGAPNGGPAGVLQAISQNQEGSCHAATEVE